MPVTNDAKRSTRRAEQFNVAIQQAIDYAEDAVLSYNANSVSSDLSDVASDATIIGSGEQAIDKDRALDTVTLAASILYYLKDMTDGSGNTLLGTAALSPTDIKNYLERLSA